MLFRSQHRVFCAQSLRCIQRLGADLAHVVDTHQRARKSFVWRREHGAVAGHRRAGAACTRLGKQGAQGVVGAVDQGIHRAGISISVRKLAV